MIKGILDTARQAVRAHLSCYRTGYQSAAGPTQIVPAIKPGLQTGLPEIMHKEQYKNNKQNKSAFKIHQIYKIISHKLIL